MISTVSMLFIVLAGLMMLVGKGAGLRSFLSIMLNFGLLFLIVLLISWGFSVVAVTLIIGVCILAVTIFLGNNNEETSITAFYATLIVLIILTGLILGLQNQLQVQGFGNENTDSLEGMSLLIGLKFQDVMSATMIISTLGAIAEAAIAEAAGLSEIIEINPTIKVQRLLQYGLSVGKEIIGTGLNTLFFGFFGGFLGLFIWYVRLNYSFGKFLNDKIFVSEVVMVLFAFIGLALTVPLTIGVLILRRKKLVTQDTKKDRED